MIKSILRPLKRIVKEPYLRAKWSSRAGEVKARFDVAGPRIIYAITPPSQLSNIGDQAQVVAIYDWFKRFFPEHNVIEIDKDEVIHLVNHFKPFVKDDDIIVLHSGGNLGDRGIWSETSRRTMIQNFPKNKIVSLPQTIHFSDTEKGRKELENSRSIYNAHPDLTVMGRDHQSYALAQEYFEKCKTFESPDFVLSYRWAPDESKETNGKMLYCLRVDSESAINAEQREKLLALAPKPYDVFDTTISEPITKESRKRILDETLQMFSEYDLIVTDRYHGLIFSVLAKRPTVVLPTVDHKLTSAFDWFDEVKFVRFAPEIEAVPGLIDEVAQVNDRSVTDWVKVYFEPMTKLLQ